MIASLDVHYQDPRARSACVVFPTWAAEVPHAEYLATLDEVADYVPGQFYRRELPCLEAVLAQVREPLEAVVVDGHAWLGPNRPGLGAHLFEALGQRVPVIGVAKTAFAGNELAIPVRRGQSARPLYVSAAGVSAALAADWIGAMHGEHRLPTLLKRVDRLCREG